MHRLERNLAFEPLVEGNVNGRHAAGRDVLADLVAAVNDTAEQRIRQRLRHGFILGWATRGDSWERSPGEAQGQSNFFMSARTDFTYCLVSVFMPFLRTPPRPW